MLKALSRFGDALWNLTQSWLMLCEIILACQRSRKAPVMMRPYAYQFGLLFQCAHPSYGAQAAMWCMPQLERWSLALLPHEQNRSYLVGRQIGGWVGGRVGEEVVEANEYSWGAAQGEADLARGQPHHLAGALPEVQHGPLQLALRAHAPRHRQALRHRRSASRSSLDLSRAAT